MNDNNLAKNIAAANVSAELEALGSGHESAKRWRGKWTTNIYPTFEWVSPLITYFLFFVGFGCIIFLIYTEMDGSTPSSDGSTPSPDGSTPSSDGSTPKQTPQNPWRWGLIVGIIVSVVLYALIKWINTFYVRTNRCINMAGDNLDKLVDCEIAYNVRKNLFSALANMRKR